MFFRLPRRTPSQTNGRVSIVRSPKSARPGLRLERLEARNNPADIFNYGTPGPDTQIDFGTPDPDRIEQYGYAGNDIQSVDAGAGNDTVLQDGGADDDTQVINGGSGNDTISQEGDLGNDNLTTIAGVGDDVVFQDGGDGDDLLNSLDGDGNDSLTVNGGAGNDSITCTLSTGVETALLDGGTGIDSVTINSHNVGFTLQDAAGHVLYSQGTGGSVITVTSANITVLASDGVTVLFSLTVAQGTDGDDTQTYFGTPGNDTVQQYGDGGNDLQSADLGAGDDYVMQDGGEGNDTQVADGGTGNDTISQEGEFGNDNLTTTAGQGDDIVFAAGGDGDDHINTVGGDGNDSLTLHGGSGNDNLRVAAGDDSDSISVLGEAGVDSITYDVSTGNDTALLDGGTGIDSVTINSKNQSFTVRDAAGHVLYSQGTGGSVITVTSANITVLASDGVTVLFSLTVAQGTDGDDTQTYFGTPGNDTVQQYGDGGNDLQSADMGAGDDYVLQDGGAGNDTSAAAGGAGNDTFTYVVSPGNDTATIEGGVGRDSLTVTNPDNHSFTLRDADGNVLFHYGTGSSEITVTGVEQITALDPQGNVIYTGPPATATDLYAVGAGIGGGPHVKVYNADGSQRFSFMAYDPAFLGGVRVAVGDVNGDGTADIITAAGPGGGPHVKVFSGVDASELESFMAYDLRFWGGVFVAAGDVNGDGRADVVTGAGFGGGPHVKVYDGATGAVSREFLAYDAGFFGGVTVAAGDVTGDGKADVVTGAGLGGGPHVKVFDGVTGTVALEFLAYDPAFRGGVNVAAGDINGDGNADIVTGAGLGGAPHVKTFDGTNGSVLDEFMAYDPGFFGGVHVAAGDLNGDGRADIITGAGFGGGPHVKMFNGETGGLLDEFLAYDPGFIGGVFVG